MRLAIRLQFKFNMNTTELFHISVNNRKFLHKYEIIIKLYIGKGDKRISRMNIKIWMVKIFVN